ncbi:MAG: hypothetical protein A2086_16765 [Spirochaetes bacterium GWD1_27_9]|nr:MAG: hypothetical protein A2Y34_11915 [Spirochaetes bacterium GWC1_27_15]OHD31165.1 MAG: hypothetical protein A2086_16765 [Spirochaetes bacterium GWD1_27_9]
MKKIFLFFFITTSFYLHSNEYTIKEIVDCSMDLIRNTVSLQIENETFDFELSSSFNDFVSISNITLEKLKNPRFIDSKTILIKQIKMGKIIFENVIAKIEERDTIGFGILSNFNLNIDYFNKKLEISKNLFNEGFDFTIKDNFATIYSKIQNWDITTDIKLDFLAIVSSIDHKIIKKINLANFLFPVVEYYSTKSIFPQKINYYQSINLTIDKTDFYNKNFIISDKKNNFGSMLNYEFFNSSQIKIDFTNKKIKITNNNSFDQKIEHFLSENNIKETKILLEQVKDSTKYYFYKSIVLKREGFDKEAKEMIATYIESDFNKNKTVDLDLLKFYILYLEDYSSRITTNKISKIIENTNNIENELEIQRFYAIASKNLDYYNIKGSNGVIKYKLWKNKIIPQFSINGIKQNSLIFDTGAPVVLLSKALARRLKVKIIMQNGISVTSGFRSEESLYLDIGLIDKINFSGIEIKNVICVITPSPIFVGIDGLIGGNIINQFNYIISKEKYIYFQKRRNNQRKIGNMSLINEKPYIQTQIDGFENKYFLLFDTGNDSSFGSFNILIEETKNVLKHQKKVATSLDILGVDFYTLLHNNEQIVISDKKIQKNKFEYRLTPMFDFPDKVKNYGNIGFDIVKNYTIKVNFDKMEFVVE